MSVEASRDAFGHLSANAVGRAASTRHAWTVVAVLAGLCVVAFWPVLSCGFINVDDQAYVTANPRVQAGLTGGNVKWAFTTFHAGLWVPLTWLSLMLDAQVYGLRAWGFHLTNLLLHAANGVLLFLVLGRSTGSLWRSALAAAVFAMHPLRVESVAWVTERKDVLAGFFGLLTMLVYVWEPGRRRPLAWALFAASMMGKPMMATLPAVLLLLDWWPLGRLHRATAKALALEKLPMVAIAAAASLATYQALHGEGLSYAWGVVALPLRLANAALSYILYLWKMLWFGELTLFYPYPASIPAGRVVAAVAAMAGITTLAVACRRRAPWLLVGWLWFVGALVPMIGILQAGDQAMADRYSYFPMVGVLIMVVWSIPDAWVRVAAGRAATVVASCAAVAVLCVFTYRQCGYWTNSATLWEHGLRVTEGNWLAHYCLGTTLNNGGRARQAIPHFRETLRLMPTFFEAHYDLGVALAAEGDAAAAVEEYRQAIRMHRRHVRARGNLAKLLFERGKVAEAAAECTQALAIDADYLPARVTLALALTWMGRPMDAVEQCRIALEQRPDSAEAYNSLGIALAQLARGRGRRGVPHGHTPPARPCRAAWQPRAARAIARHGAVPQTGDIRSSVFGVQPSVQAVRSALSEAEASAPAPLFQGGRLRFRFRQSERNRARSFTVRCG